MGMPTAISRTFGSIALSLLLCGAAHSEVTMSSPQAFDLTLEVQVAQDSDSVWDALLEDTGKWWHPSGTMSGEPENVSLEAWAGGCICETLNDGGSVRQLEVVLVSRDAGILQAVGGIGPLRSLPVAGVFTFTVEDLESGGTKIGFSYKVAGGGQLEELAAPVDALLAQQLERLSNWVDKGTVGN
jgi:uncharacterized protein YndB with AHSA1/START domain